MLLHACCLATSSLPRASLAAELHDREAALQALHASSADALAGLRAELAAEVATVEALQAQADAREAAAAKLSREVAAAAKANGQLAELLAAAQVCACGCLHALLEWCSCMRQSGSAATARADKLLLLCCCNHA